MLSTIKLYLMGAAAVAILSFLTWGALHERAVEHTKDVAVATKAVAKVEKQDGGIVATATSEIQHEQVIYKQAVSVPPVGDIGVVCESSGGNAVPGPASGNTSGHPGADGGAGNLYDPSGGLLTVGHKYDAWIRELQAENATLRQELASAQKVHR
jgi:hypothetical protein